MAVSTDGQKILEREYHNLERLGELALFEYLPKVYDYGCIQIDAQETRLDVSGWNGLRDTMNSTSQKKKNTGPAGLRYGIQKRGKFFYQKNRPSDCMNEATAILAAYFNLETYEQIFSWHHAAGDFVVNMDEAAPRVRLITVRRYERLFDKAG